MPRKLVVVEQLRTELARKEDTINYLWASGQVHKSKS